MLRLIDALLLAGVAVAGIGMLLWFTGDGIITAEGGARRLSSVYGSPNNVGLLLGRCIPFALAYVLVSLDRTRRVVAGIVLVTMLVAAILTQSAGALFIGIPAAVAAVLLLSWRRRAILPLALLFIIGLTAVLFALQMPRFARALDPAEGTNFYRVRVWQSAMEAIEDHPLLGLGLDQFLYDFRGTYMMPDAWEEPDLSHPHNIILDFWTRLGMSGVIWLIFIQAAFWRTIARKYHQLYPKKPVLLAVLVGTSGAMVNLLAHGTVDNSIYVVDLAYIFVLLLGIASMLQYNDIREEDGKIVA
jgi:O-antigen ligase